MDHSPEEASMLPRPLLSCLALTAASVVALSGVRLPATHAETTTGRARIVHMAPHDPGVDVLIDGARSVPDLTFRSASSYLTLPVGAHALQLVPAGGTTPTLLSQPLDIRAGQDQTVVALGVPPTIQDLVLTDDNQPPAPGMAKVRFVHAGADVPAVDVAVSGGPLLFQNVGFEGVAGPLEVPAGSYSLQVRAAGTSNVLMLLPNVTLQAGQNLTLFGAGLRSDNTFTVVALPYTSDANQPTSASASASASNEATTPIVAVTGVIAAGSGGGSNAVSAAIRWLLLLSALALCSAALAWGAARHL
jgi:hypothetical protein